jgi:hypothetical protein
MSETLHQFVRQGLFINAIGFAFFANHDAPHREILIKSRSTLHHWHKNP